MDQIKFEEELKQIKVIQFIHTCFLGIITGLLLTILVTK